ncbi:hypothetical protein B0H13DRAFT_1891999 [Mycena leptocephala]|nr:hypothetical protein B0H13DRAFT_1891999 [Mycena leptocephala]
MEFSLVTKFTDTSWWKQWNFSGSQILLIPGHQNQWNRWKNSVLAPGLALGGEGGTAQKVSLGGANGRDVLGRDANSQCQEPPVATRSSFNGAFGVTSSNVRGRDTDSQHPLQKNPTRRDGSQFDPDEEPDQLDQWQNNDEGAGDLEDDEEYQDSNPGAGGEDDDNALSITSENLDQDGRGGRGGHQSINAYEDPDDDLEYLDDRETVNVMDARGMMATIIRLRFLGLIGPSKLKMSSWLCTAKKNRANRPPNPAKLDRFHVLQEGWRDEEEEGGNNDRDDDCDDNDNDDEDEGDGQCGRKRKKRTTRSDDPPPTLMSFFQPSWRQALDRGKLKVDRHMLLHQCFPDKKDFPELARKQFLNEAITEVEDEHEIDLDKDFYQKYQPAMIEIGHKNNFMNAGLQIAAEALLFGRANSRGDTVAHSERTL